MTAEYLAGDVPPLLRLPYDIRIEIFHYLFPRNRQIHIMADKQGLSVMLFKGEIPLNLFSVCRQMQRDAAAHLCNNYLFNVVGLTSDCVTRYEPLQQAIRKYAAAEVRTDIFDNGVLSSTACISIYASGGLVESIAHRRRRGVPRELDEVKLELANATRVQSSAFWSSQSRLPGTVRLVIGSMSNVLRHRLVYVLACTLPVLIVLLTTWLR